MKRTLLALTCLLSSITAHATVIDGKLFSQVPSVQTSYTTVDFYSFKMNSAGALNIDLLSWEELGKDVNNDGKYAFLDTMIWIFKDSISVANLIFQNDDNGFFGNDGSISSLDSYLSANLAMGNYWLAVGACCNFGAEDIVDGKQQNNRLYTFDANTNPIENDVGNYRITFTGDATITSRPDYQKQVTAPATLAAFGLGLAALAFRRRDKTVSR
jgi:hypothetical protein